MIRQQSQPATRCQIPSLGASAGRFNFRHTTGSLLTFPTCFHPPSLLHCDRNFPVFRRHSCILHARRLHACVKVTKFQRQRLMVACKSLESYSALLSLNL